MGTVGHSWAFAAFTATGANGLLAHMLIINPTAWAVMRVTTSLCVAGCYTVIEAWLQAKVTNQTRRRTIGAYQAVNLGASLASQLMINALTNPRPPETPKAPRLRPMLAVPNSLLAAVGVVVAALSGASFRMVGPIYGTEVGLKLTRSHTFWRPSFSVARWHRSQSGGWPKNMIGAMF